MSQPVQATPATVNAESTSLYVSGLVIGSTEETVRTIFEPFKEDITEIIMTSNSRSVSANLKFKSHDVAKKALDETIYTKVGDVPIMVQWQTENLRYPVDARLFVSGLPQSIDEFSLHSAFKEFGEVVGCYVNKKADGSSLGTASVQFVDPEAAEAAIAGFSGALIEGQAISVEKFKAPDQRSEIDVQLPKEAIAINGDFDEETIAQQLGAKSIFMAGTSPQDKRAIVFFDSHEKAEEVISKPPEIFVGRIVRRVKKQQRSQALLFIESRKVFVSNLDVTSVDALKTHLEQAGEIVSITMNKSAVIGPTATVQYKSTEARYNAVSKLNYTTFPGQVLPIIVQPFLDKRVEHPEGSLLVLPEIPEGQSISDIQAQCAKTGHFVAITTSENYHCSPIVYVLFDSAEAALSVEGFNNKLTLSPVCLTDVTFAFSYPQNINPISLTFTGLPSNISYEAFLKEMQQVGTVTKIQTFKMDGTWNAVVGISIRADVQKLYTYAKKKSYNVTLTSLAPNTAFNRFAYTSLHIENRAAHVMGLDANINAARLRKYAEKFGAVEGATIFYNDNYGESFLRGIVLFKEEAGMKAFIESTHFELGSDTSASQFIKRQRNNGIQTPTEQPLQIPSNVTRRQYLLQKARSVLPDTMHEDVVAKVNNMTIQQTYDATESQAAFDSWLKTIQ